jgi:hypothetical protein
MVCHSVRARGRHGVFRQRSARGVTHHTVLPRRRESPGISPPEVDNSGRRAGAHRVLIESISFLLTSLEPMRAQTMLGPGPCNRLQITKSQSIMSVNRSLRTGTDPYRPLRNGGAEICLANSAFSPRRSPVWRTLSLASSLLGVALELALTKGPFRLENRELFLSAIGCIKMRNDSVCTCRAAVIRLFPGCLRHG